MAIRTKFGLKGKSRDSYLDLVLAFPLASIKSAEHLTEAQKVMDRLLAQGRLDDGEEIYLDALSDLVAREPTRCCTRPLASAFPAGNLYFSHDTVTPSVRALGQ